MRIITGRPFSFFDIRAGIAIDCAPGILLPNPPPVYSLTRTSSSGLMPTQPATDATVRARLCVDTCTWHLPFCQYAMADRDSSGWCDVVC